MQIFHFSKKKKPDSWWKGKKNGKYTGCWVSKIRLIFAGYENEKGLMEKCQRIKTSQEMRNFFFFFFFFFRKQPILPRV